MTLQKVPITNCHYNQIGFPRLDNVNINFINNSSQHGINTKAPFHVLFNGFESSKVFKI